MDHTVTGRLNAAEAIILFFALVAGCVENEGESLNPSELTENDKSRGDSDRPCERHRAGLSPRRLRDHGRGL